MTLTIRTFENLLDRGGNDGNQDFLLFSQCFLSVNPFPNKPWFLECLQYKSFENTVGKGEIANDEQFLLFPKHFLPFFRTFHHFQQT